LKDSEEWRDLFRFAKDLMDAGKEIKAPGLYIIGNQLVRKLTKLAEVEIENLRFEEKKQ